MMYQPVGRDCALPCQALTLVLAFALCLPACLCAATSEPDALDSKRILDEIVAGNDANLELIDHGRAVYEVTAEYKDPSGERSDTWVYTIYFDYPLLRADMPEQVLVYKPDYVIRYTPDTGRLAEPADHRALIQDPAVASPPPFHPRSQQGPDRATPMPRMLSTALARADLDVTITASRCADGNIELRYEAPSQYFRGVYVFAPQLGYSLTRIERYALMVSDSVPYNEATMSYRRLPSGAYVVEECHRVSRLREGAHSYITETVTRLVDFDPARPSPDVFRLEAMGLPEGARIDDRINRRHYIYGVTAVTEDDIGAVDVTGPWRGTTPRQMLVIGTLVIGLAVLWFGVIRRRSGG